MADGVYVGMSGAAARAEQLESIADSLANAQTPGFLASRPSFESFLAEHGNSEFAYTAAVSTGVDLTPGPIAPTGRPTDVAPQGGSFLAVGLDGGQVGYTRDGRLTADPSGALKVGELPVLGDDGKPIRVAAGAPFTVDPQGRVLSGGQEVGRLGRFELSGPVERRGGSVVVPRSGAVATPSAAELRPGALIQANAGPLEAAVQMVSAQRNYETSMQAISTYRRLDERANELGRTR
ncbi:MAG: flagellar hook basal-body protein [Myxococcaceae bacterium]|nr:flagellar hook basal-body protein [Myxococcaceae bacterium]